MKFSWQTKKFNANLAIHYLFPCGVVSGNFREPFFMTQNFWTFMAVVVALATPWIMHWLNNRPQKSDLLFEGISIVNQKNDDNPTHLAYPGPFNVGRIIVKNSGKYKARSVEAYIEKIIWNKKERNDFFPVPLYWTHGQLNKNCPTVRDVYPNQTVYLDIFYHVFDPNYIEESSVLFAIAAGRDIENLSRMNRGKSELLVKLYQESGQVNELRLGVTWEGKNVPKISILNK